MPRPRAPVPPDPERLTRMLESARSVRTVRLAAGGAGGPASWSGWVPEALSPTELFGDAEPVGEGVVREEDAPGPAAASRESTEPPEALPLPSGRHRRGPRVLTLPTPFRGAHLVVPWRAVVALLLVLAVAALFFAVRVARTQEAATPQVVPAGGGLVGRTVAPTAFGTASATGLSAGSVTATAPRRIVVDVIGQVTRPGVVSVPEGSRVTDVLVAVGGASPGADVQRLNLARVVTDGEQLFVPKPGETPPVPLGGGVGGSGSPGSGSPAASGGFATGGVVDLNTAGLAALDGLPGVGPVLAQRILDWRAEHGRFSSVDELGEVSGIGDKLLAQIRTKVRVG